jgi:hypothetical protein
MNRERRTIPLVKEAPNNYATVTTVSTTRAEGGGVITCFTIERDEARENYKYFKR